MRSDPYLSVVMPCYNEERNIERGVLRAIYEFLRKQSYTSEVIVVDDGSTDRSCELIEEFIGKKPHFSLVKNSHQGKARAVITGILQAKGKIILFSDLDQATPLSECTRLLPFFKTHDIVIGSRRDERRGAPLSRIVMARGFIMLRSLLLGITIHDTQCGFKAFKKEIAHPLFKKLRLYKNRKTIEGSHVTAGFDVELLFLAQKLGYRIKEVPVVWNYVETRRVSPLRDSWEGFIDLLRIKIDDMRGRYD
ncbi:glycosyltransferase [Candidatus Roizmanbacteria bacterium]|nr:glycosyltransferase [Candidatus Roizmanbacteria bacterium]